MKCSKAIIAVAGYGTRWLPLTKAIEKCMLPVLTRPIIDYPVQECIAAGIRDIYFVVGNESRQLREYYQTQPMLERYLTRKNQPALLKLIQPPADVTFHYITQDLSDDRYGTSVPVWLARDYIDDDEYVLIMMGDQALYRSDGGSDIADLMQALEQADVDGALLGNTIAEDMMGHYGIIETDDAANYRRIIEKPQPDSTTSRLNNSSVYVMPQRFLEVITHQIKGGQRHEGEYYLTDAVNDFVASGNTVRVVTARGEYLDCGTLTTWVQANTYMMSQTQGES